LTIRVGICFALYSAVVKTAGEQSVKLEKANHLKGWDAKPLALNRGDGKAAGLPGGNSTSVECVSVGFGRNSTEVLQ